MWDRRYSRFVLHLLMLKMVESCNYSYFVGSCLGVSESVYKAKEDIAKKCGNAENVLPQKLVRLKEP